MMESAHSFLIAYCKFDPLALLKLLSDGEVRCVMHVHQQKCDTRSSFPSLQHIAKALDDEANAMDERLHVWSKLNTSEEEPTASSVGLREIRKGGSVVDSQMHARGFRVGAKHIEEGCMWQTYGRSLHWTSRPRPSH